MHWIRTDGILVVEIGNHCVSLGVSCSTGVNNMDKYISICEVVKKLRQVLWVLKKKCEMIQLE